MIDRPALSAFLALQRGQLDRALLLLDVVDEMRFVAFCREHQIAGYCHTLLEAESLPENFSTEIIWRLRAAYLEQWTRSERLLRELVRLARCFEESGEEFILLKGLHSAVRYYGDSDRRAMNDLDLLVRRSAFGRSRRILECEGYRSHSPRPLSSRLLIPFVHHLEFESENVPLDLHHAIRTHPSLRIPEADLWRDRHAFQIGGKTIHVLSDAHALLVTILTVQTDIGLGTITLRPLLDLHMILRRTHREIDWDAFLAEREREGTAKLCLNVLALFLTVFEGQEEFPELTRLLLERPQRQVFVPHGERYLDLLGGAPLDRKKQWAFRLYEYPLLLSTLWWVASLPVVLAAYPRTFFRNLPKRIAGRLTTERPDRDPVPVWMPDVRAFGLGADAFDTATARFGSLTTRFQTHRPLYREMIEELFRIELGEPAAGEEPTAVISVFDTDLETLREHTSRPERPIVERPLEGITEIHHRIASAYVYHARQPIEVLIAVRPRGQSREEVLHCLMLVFYKVLYRLGWVQLHAAAIQMGAGANLFVGGKGAGKSTLSLKLGLAGGTVLGEDHVMLRQRDGVFVASGCDPNMRLTEETESHFFDRPLAIEQEDFGGTMKKELLARDVVSSEPYRDAPISRMFFPRVTGSFAVTPLPRATALIRVLDMIRDRHAFSGRDDLAEFLDRLVDFVTSVDCYDLELSDDLSDLDHVVSWLQRS